MSLALPPTKLLIVAVLHAILGECSLYYIVVLNTMEPWVTRFAAHSIKDHYGVDVSEQHLYWIWALVSGSLVIGMMLGSMTLHFALESFGRRNMIMLIKNCLLLVSALLQGLSKMVNSLELLVAGRILAGVAYVQTEAVHMYLTECSPTAVRGLISCLPTVGSRLWFVAGALLSTEMCGASEDTWHMVLMYPIIPAFMHLLLAPLVPESPKHLYITQDNEAAADKAILFYHGPDADLHLIKQEYGKEAKASKKAKSTTMLQVLKHRHMRWPLALIVVSMVTGPLSGNEVTLLYSSSIMVSLGVDQSKASLYTLLCIQVPAALLGFAVLLFVDKLGRRPILLGGLGLCFSGQVLFTTATPVGTLSPTLSKVFGVVGMALIITGYSAGPSTLSLLAAGEIAPQASRALSLSVAWFAMLSFSSVILFSFPSLNGAIGTYSCAPFAVCTALCWLFLYKFMPETKGKSVDQVISRWM